MSGRGWRGIKGSGKSSLGDEGVRSVLESRSFPVQAKEGVGLGSSEAVEGADSDETYLRQQRLGHSLGRLASPGDSSIFSSPMQSSLALGSPMAGQVVEPRVESVLQAKLRDARSSVSSTLETPTSETVGVLAQPSAMPTADGPTKIRRMVARAHSGQRRTGPEIIQRVILDPEYEDDVLDAAAGKREAEVSDMKFLGRGITAADPRVQSLDAFFQDPAHRKGNRSYPAQGPGARASGGAAPLGNVNQAVLPDVLIMGPTSAMLPEQADGEHQVNQIFAAIIATDNAHGLIVAPMRKQALAEITAAGKSKVSKVSHGAGQAGDSAALAAAVGVIVERFRADSKRAVDQANWEDSVRARMAFVGTKGDKPMAEQAYDRAGKGAALANDIYDKLYAVLAFAKPAIGEITAGACEQALLNLCAAVGPVEWPALLNAFVGEVPLRTFALAHLADLTGIANTAAVARVWQANEVAISSVADAQTILALGFVNGDVALAIRAVRLVGTPQIPDIPAMSAIAAGGVIQTIKRLAELVSLGGHLTSNIAMRALVPKLNDDQIITFNTKAGPTPVLALASWNLLVNNVADDTKKFQIVRSLVVAPSATKANFELLVNNYASLMDRTSISQATVATLVTCGMLWGSGNSYRSKTWGPGCAYAFTFAGQGRIDPEWHIHFNFGKKTTVAGAGWKDKGEKYGSGVKSFGSAPQLEAALRAAKSWREPKL